MSRSHSAFELVESLETLIDFRRFGFGGLRRVAFDYGNINDIGINFSLHMSGKRLGAQCLHTRATRAPK
jgi:hypothetical protein